MNTAPELFALLTFIHKGMHAVDLGERALRPRSTCCHRVESLAVDEDDAEARFAQAPSAPPSPTARAMPRPGASGRGQREAIRIATVA